MPFDAKCSPHPAREKGRRARDQQRVQLLFHPRSSDSPRAYALHTYIVSQLLLLLLHLLPPIYLLLLLPDPSPRAPTDIALPEPPPLNR